MLYSEFSFLHMFDVLTISFWLASSVDRYKMKLHRYPLFCEVSFQQTWKAFCFNFSLLYKCLNMP